MPATSGPFWGVAPYTAPFNRYVIASRISDEHPATVVAWAWTRRGAERKKRSLERRRMYADEHRLARGLDVGPGVRYDILDLHEHPDNRGRS